MKKHKWKIIIILIFIVGLSVMLYPNFSNYWNSRSQSKVVASYNQALKEIPQEDYEEMLEEAKSYNEALQNIDFPFRNFDLVDGYENILDVTGTGIMGYLSIEKINVELPIYHGTSDGVLQVGVGHMQGSSLPTGGIGNHIVLSAHNGLADAELFTNLDQLEEGDTFTITVLDQELIYQVDQILVVEPEDFSELAMDEEKDYCTLLTCTPFGVNSHRLLVRGVRVSQEESQTSSEEAQWINTDIIALVIFALISMVALLIWLLWYVVRGRKKNRNRKELKKNGGKHEKV